MELNFPSFPLLLLSFLFIFMVTIHVKKGRKYSKRIPPGPWKLPLIGNIHQLISPLPHRTLTNLAQKYGPLMHFKLGEVSMVVISSPEVAKQALKDNDIIFSERPFLLAASIMSYNSTGILFSPYGAYWRQMRKICATQLLSQRRVLGFREVREEEVFNLIKYISKNEGIPVNLSKLIYSLTFGITARTAFGRKSKNQEEFVELVRVALALAAGFTIADLYPSMKMIQWISGMRRKLEKLHKRIDWLLQNIINEHRDRIHKDEERNLVDVLLRIQKESNLEVSLSDNNIKAVILDIFGGGSDTSSITLEWAMSEMLKNPPIMRRAQAEVRQVFDKNGNVDEAHIDELEYLDCIIKEIFRLHPPGPLLSPKENSEDCEINGFRIPAKSKVIVNAWAIGRDPNYWIEPEKFKPERFLDNDIDFRGNNFEYIPFGAGRRVCPGISFALPGLKLALAQLLFHFDWKLANGSEFENLDMEEEFGLIVKRKNDLMLLPILHESSQQMINQVCDSLPIELVLPNF